MAMPILINFLPTLISRIKRLFFCSLLASLLIFASCWPQKKLDRKWPIHKGLKMTPYDDADVEQGFVLKKNGDTVRGYLKMVILYPEGGKFDHVPVLPYGKTQAADIINVPLSEIDYARIGFTWPQARDTIDYMPVGDAMWHVLGRKGDAGICQGVYVEGPFWGDRLHVDFPMALVVGGKILTIPTKPSQYRALLLFANNRYHKDLAPKKYKDKKDLIDYILDKETSVTAAPDTSAAR